LAEELAGFSAGDASVGGEAVEVVEAGEGGPGGEGSLAELGETFLETVEGFAGVGIPRGDGAAGAGVAAFQMNVADGETNGAAFVGAE